MSKLFDMGCFQDCVAQLMCGGRVRFMATRCQKRCARRQQQYACHRCQQGSSPHSVGTAMDAVPPGALMLVSFHGCPLKETCTRNGTESETTCGREGEALSFSALADSCEGRLR